MVKQIKDYGGGKIYIIRCLTNDQLTYIGSTIYSLKKRFNSHKAMCKKKNWLMYKAVKDDVLGWENWEIYLLVNYPCNTKSELEKQEGIFQLLLKSSLNERIAGALLNNPTYKKDHNKAYKATHKEEQKAYQAKFYLNNPGYKHMKNAEYRLRQKEQKELNEAIIL